MYFKTENKMDAVERRIQWWLRPAVWTVSPMLPRGIRKGDGWGGPSGRASAMQSFLTSEINIRKTLQAGEIWQGIANKGRSKRKARVQTFSKATGGEGKTQAIGLSAPGVNRSVWNFPKHCSFCHMWSRQMHYLTRCPTRVLKRSVQKE